MKEEEMSDKDSENTDTEFSFMLTNDYTFKRVMGAEENKDALQDFLACVLALPAGEISTLALLDRAPEKNYLIF